VENPYLFPVGDDLLQLMMDFSELFGCLLEGSSTGWELEAIALTIGYIYEL